MMARWKGREAVFALELPLILAASELPADVDFGAKRESLPLAARSSHSLITMLGLRTTLCSAAIV